MGPWLVWLGKLALSPRFVKWLIDQLGPNALKLFGEWLGRIRNRQIAIDEADQIDGHFSGAIIDGERHVVVWRDGEPISAYPPITNGDLKEKLRHHSREDLKRPDDLPTQRAKSWVKGHVPGLGDDEDQLDDSRFRAALKRIEPLLAELRGSPQHRVRDHPSSPAAPGIYMFSDHGKPIYVGQSRNLRRRLAQHTAANSRENAASFAFNLAKRAARDAGMDISGSRKAIEVRPEFAEYFERARKEVAEMAVQFIELADPIERTLFEIYVSLALETDEFNSFETH
jgi:hypothetical protein